MRCKNCGWPNKPGETTCVKCNAPLESDYSETILEEHNGSLSRGGMNSTIPEHVFFGGELENKECEEKVCPKCGYPLKPNTSKCPNCNYDVAPLFANNMNDKTNSRVTRMDNPASANGVKGTINPYMIQEAAAPTFQLKPITRIGEKKELSSMEYEGETVLLNRSNTEPGNESITSHTQAEVVFESGSWFIEDKSEQGTTFVRASKKYELADGDIILLGNRLFEFHKSNE